MPETVPAQKIPDTFGRIYTKLLTQLDLFSVSSKTSPGTFQWDSRKFTEAFEIWVTELRAESTQRQKLAHRMNENAFSYLPSWKTPVSSEHEGGIMEVRSGMDARLKLRDQAVNWRTPMSQDFGGTTRADFSPKLSEQIQKWPTPITTRGDYQKQQDGTRAPKLSGAVRNWPTPTTMDKMDPKSDKAILREVTEVRPGRKTFANLRDSVVRGPAIDFRLDRALSNSNGKNRARLNPAWSIQLMGTTLQKTFTVPLAIQWLNRPPNSLTSTSCENTSQLGALSEL
uniref:hypothetical protein n=1 Tax=Dyadobacter sp. OTU695 TaxID=3043860 RepID=UPI00313D66C8